MAQHNMKCRRFKRYMNKIPYKICVGMASGQPYRLRHKCTKGEGPKDWALPNH